MPCLSVQPLQNRTFVLDWHSLKNVIYLSAFTPLAQPFGQFFLPLPKPLHNQLISYITAVSCFLSHISGCKAGSRLQSALLKIFAQPLNNY